MPPAASTDELARAASGDPSARTALVRAHGPLVWALCRRLAREPDDAYQAIWEKVFRALPRFDPGGPASLRTWIAVVARRHLTDRHRRNAVRGEVVSIEALPPVEPVAEAHAALRQRQARLELALQRLPADQRSAVVLHHIHGVDLDTLAREAGVAVGTIKSRLHRGRARLAQLLEDR
ncbi:MAG: RNA polymerase sigma-70 factor (ECF subfamily) [Myxococcota bacterium]|jgi:RNA polymerase sigma-70 factor (ECF subfamily)